MRNNKKKIIIMLIIAITFLTLFVVWGLNAKSYWSCNIPLFNI